MWLKYANGIINLDSISSIDTKTFSGGIVVKVKIPSNDTSNYIATFSSREKVQKFLSKLSDYMNQGMKCIDIDVLVTQVENECRT